MTETTPADTPAVIATDTIAQFWAADERVRGAVTPNEADGTSLNGGPISTRGLSGFRRSAPALTPAERLHLELYGYVVIEGMLTPAEVDQLRGDIYAIERKFRSGDDLRTLRPAFVDPELLRTDTADNFRIHNLPHVAPSFFDYLTHPRIVGMTEELMGGRARLVRSDAHIRRPAANPDDEKYSSDNFHRLSRGQSGTTANGLYHFPFVKALTNLTDWTPEDGSPSVIPGSHKLPADLDEHAVIGAALGDPSLIHRVHAPAGSTLIYVESLLHSIGAIRSGRDQVMLLGGYAPHMFAAWAGMEPAAELVRRLPEEYQRFFLGWYSTYWSGINARSLADQVG
ncbi:phytanoyl-CoA dioxygenase family protein [Streptomyces sp. NPDC001508]|uniref:phytanoyl-CoA dioxygenase family protein n=1 Tax=Streptomyces sp. NPDC001508 TaxID=3154656 RepID=UPI003331AB22